MIDQIQAGARSAGDADADDRQQVLDFLVTQEQHGSMGGSRAGRLYEYPGDPLASGVGTPVSHTVPA